MHENTEKTLLRDCEAIQIPAGTKIILRSGTRVFITQSLGGSYTVATDQGLARIADENADALGIERAQPAAPMPANESGPVDEKAVWNQLRTCYDPEIPVNIVDLGLVYDCRIDGSKVEVKMTLTAPGCGMGPTICAEAKGRLLTVPGVEDAEVDLVWDPPWNQGMISEAGRMKLGLV